MSPLLALLFLSRASHARPEADLPDPSAAMVREVQLADERLRGLAAQWQQRQQRVTQDPALSAWLTGYREAQAAASTAAFERTLKRDALEEARQRAYEARYSLERCGLRSSEIDEELALRESDLSRRVAEARGALDAAPGLDARAAGRALSAWSGRWSDMDWEAALSRPDGLDALHRAGRDLERAAQPVPERRPQIQAILSAAELAEALQVQRRDERARCAALDVEGLEAQASRLEDELRAVEARLATVAAELASLEATRPASARLDADPFLVEARALSTAYASARGRLDSELNPISHDLWCRIHINGAVAKLFAGDYDTAATLATAAAAYQDGCVGYADAWGDLAIFQQEWSKARSDPARATTATLWVRFPASSGRWRIDGVEVSGNGWERFVLLPGPHRVEHLVATGRPLHQYLELEGGYAYTAEADEQQIRLKLYTGERLREGERDGGGEERPREREEIQEGPREATPSFEPLTSSWSVTLSSAWMRAVGTDHAGGALSGAWALRSGPKLRLELGVTHEMGLGERSWQYTEGGASRFLFRESLSLALVRGLGSDLRDYVFRPRVELALGTIPFNAVTFGLNAGLDLRVTRRGFLRLMARGGTSLWGDGFTPALQGPDGGAVWDLTANAGFGYHL